MTQEKTKLQEAIDCFGIDVVREVKMIVELSSATRTGLIAPSKTNVCTNTLNVLKCFILNFNVMGVAGSPRTPLF